MAPSLAFSIAAATLNLGTAALFLALARAPGWRIARVLSFIALTAGLYNAAGAVFSIDALSAATYANAAKACYLVATLHCCAWIVYAYAGGGLNLRELPRSLCWLIGIYMASGCFLTVTGMHLQPRISLVRIAWANVTYHYPLPTPLGDAYGALLPCLLLVAFARLVRRYRSGERDLLLQLVAMTVFMACVADEVLVANRVITFLSLADLGFLSVVAPLSWQALRHIIRDAHRVAAHSTVLEAEVFRRTDERDQIQSALVQAEQQISELVADLDAIVWEMDAETMQVLFVSEGAQTLLGYSPREWLSTPEFWTNHLHPDDRTQALASEQETVKSGKASSAEYRMLAADGREVWFRDFFHPVPGPNGVTRRVRGVMVDITAQLRIEEQFRQAQKMEAIGRLAGGVAHDFNNLLTVINGYARMLSQSFGESDTRRQKADEIQKAGERAASLTRQLLAFSRKQAFQPKPLNLNSVVAESEQMLRRLVGAEIAIQTTLEAALGLVTADASQLHQVLMNLVVNARDAMPEGGLLRIETSNAELDDSYTALHPEVTPGAYVRLCVSDTGVGMDAETQRHVFEPFFTTKDLGKGTGLGLSGAYGIVRQNRGSICVYSQPGEGARFEIYLPRTDAFVPPPPKPAVEAEGHGGSETILLVEDMDAVRRFAAEVLRGHGYTVLEAEGGEDALRISTRHAAPIQLVVTDVAMPGMNGRQLAEQLCLLRPETKVIFISGHPAETMGARGLLPPGAQYLQKPFDPTRFAALVREVLGPDTNPVPTPNPR